MGRFFPWKSRGVSSPVATSECLWRLPEIYPNARRRMIKSQIISDNRVGLLKDLDIYETKSLGMQFVRILIDQLHGTIKVERQNGTFFKIVFKT